MEKDPSMASMKLKSMWSAMSSLCMASLLIASVVAASVMLLCRISSSSVITVTKDDQGRREGDGRHHRPPPPNIIFMLADDLGYNDVGYHNPAMKTENIDRLSSRGIRLENYYVQPVCSPTRSQLLSGRYQIHTGMQHSIIRVAQPLCHPLSDPTMADQLRKAGYATHAVGKWHLGYYKRSCWPTNRGFDSFFGMLTGSGGFYTHKHYGGHPGLSSSVNWTGYDLRDNLEQVAQDYQGVYSTHLFTQKSQNIIRRHNRSKPLFLYHSFQAVHFPLEVPHRYMEEFSFIAHEKRRVYAGMVKCMDEAVGNITRTLKKRGLWNNTIIIFSSDNGGNFNYGGNNWPLRGMKRSLWEGGIKSVGFIASPLLPKHVRGTVNNNLFHVTDWFPTLVRGVARGSLRGTHLDGHNLWKHLIHRKRSQRKNNWPRKEILHNIDTYSPIFSELPRWFSIHFPAAIRYENWKLITSQVGNKSWVPPPESGENTIHSTDIPEKRVWLFDLSEDPNETNDLSLKRTDVTYFLLSRLGAYLRGSVPIRYPGPDIRADPSMHNNSWSDWIVDE